jgi:hypothetical protein
MNKEFSGILVAISLVLIILISVLRLSPGWLFTLYMADIIICGAFAWNFASRFYRAHDKFSYLKYHGYEVLATIPAVVFYPIILLTGIVIVLRILNLVNPLSIIIHKNQINRNALKKPLSSNPPSIDPRKNSWFFHLMCILKTFSGQTRR